MLEFVKLILWKVSFDSALFEKELKKGMAQLQEEEVLLLQDWCHEVFADRYYAILNNVFGKEIRQSA